MKKKTLDQRVNDEVRNLASVACLGILTEEDLEKKKKRIADGERTAKWLMSPKGRASLARAIKQADKLTKALEKDAKVPRSNLHKPMTI